MKDIKEYIIEANNSDIMAKYSVGDKCIYLQSSGYRSQEKIIIEVVEITKVTKTILGFKFLTHFNISNNIENKQIKYKKSFGSTNAYAFTSNMSTTTMIIYKEDINKIIELIEKNKKLDFHRILHNNEQRQDYLTPIKQLKDNNIFDPSFNDYEDITKETINEIKKIIK